MDTKRLTMAQALVLFLSKQYVARDGQEKPLYYLNFLAGLAQSLANSDDPAYQWGKDTWTFKDPHLSIVHHGMEPR